MSCSRLSTGENCLVYDRDGKNPLSPFQARFLLISHNGNIQSMQCSVERFGWLVVKSFCHHHNKTIETDEKPILEVKVGTLEWYTSPFIIKEMDILDAIYISSI